MPAPDQIDPTPLSFDGWRPMAHLVGLMTILVGLQLPMPVIRAIVDAMETNWMAELNRARRE